ncbi:MAG: MltA domain-containing protein [Deltaproteobacteria bacterium]|nr:MltA domain-containing protein [Deltaproteobacteria bacterium]MBW2070188.1 MltA domain-containing protein [Deltaproteobacteria bacterium]
MVRRNLALGICFIFVLLSVTTCVRRQARVEFRPVEALERVPIGGLQFENDDLDHTSLRKAIRRSLDYLSRLPTDSVFRFGPDSVSLQRMHRSLETFLMLLDKTDSAETLAREIRKYFQAYRATGSGAEHRVLFTGYYEPTIQGSLNCDDHYRYPIYTVPADLVRIDLGRFRREYQGIQLVGRCAQNQVLPYYSRQEIDGEGILAGRDLEIVWVADPVSRFFLQIQGSGRVRLLDGSFIRLNYAASNGQPYRSIGKLLIEKQLVPKEAMSMQAIRRYLSEHPEQMDEILNYNPSYVFFQQAEQGPLGSLGVPITGGRSIATDFSLFPRGALGFIKTSKPLFSPDGVIGQWAVLERFVLNQDTGGAIKGPGRVDLFWGNGPLSRIAAGHMKHEGSLYFLVLKN